MGGLTSMGIPSFQSVSSAPSLSFCGVATVAPSGFEDVLFRGGIVVCAKREDEMRRGGRYWSGRTWKSMRSGHAVSHEVVECRLIRVSWAIKVNFADNCHDLVKYGDVVWRDTKDEKNIGG
jgi:hypothetical protein